MDLKLKHQLPPLPNFVQKRAKGGGEMLSLVGGWEFGVMPKLSA